MKSTKTNKAEVLPFVEEPRVIIVTHQVTNAYNNSYTINGGPSKCFVFGLNTSPTGCGLGLFYNWTNYIQYVDSEMRKAFIQTLKTQAQLMNFHCLVATLGDAYLKSNNKFEPFLIELGFKEIHSYENKNHGADYKQKIYACNVTDIK
jgi:hypothetical protein